MADPSLTFIIVLETELPAFPEEAFQQAAKACLQKVTEEMTGVTEAIKLRIRQKDHSGKPEFFLNTKKLSYPDEFLWQIWFLSHESYPAGSLTWEDLKIEMRGSSTDHFKKFFCLLTTEVIRWNCTNLITDDQAETLLSLLDDRGGWSMTDIKRMLQLLLHNGIAVKDKKAIADIMNDLGDDDQQTVEEILIDELSKDVVEIHTSQSYLKSLSLNCLAEDQKIFRELKDAVLYEPGFDAPAFRFIVHEEMHGNYLQLKINDLLLMPFKGLACDKRILMSGVLSGNMRNAIPLVSLYQYNEEWSIVDASDSPPAAFETAQTYLLKYLYLTLKSYSHCFINNTRVERLVNNLSNAYPELREIIKGYRQTSFYTKILRLLVEEGITLSNLGYILECILEFDYIPADSIFNIISDDRLAIINPPLESTEELPALVATFVRTMLKEYIGFKYTHGENYLDVYTLDGNIEYRLVENGLPDDERKNFIDSVKLLRKNSYNTFKLLTSAEVRLKVREMLFRECPDVIVLAYQELPPSVAINIRGKITAELIS